jgi:hypothetical protein
MLLAVVRMSFGGSESGWILNGLALVFLLVSGVRGTDGRMDRSAGGQTMGGSNTGARVRPLNNSADS